MLNLSDNELDRLSREAASQHDPGDLLGPQSWERLELRLDKELGRAGPDMSRGLRGVRRLPFQYAPVLILIVGVTYYFVKAKGHKSDASSSPPMTVVKTPQQQPGISSDPSLKNPAYSDKSTSTLYPGEDVPSGTATGTAAAPGSSSDANHPSELDRTSNPNPPSGPDHTAPGPDRTVPGLNNTSTGLARPSNHSAEEDHTASGLNKISTGLGNASSGLANHSAAGHTSSGLKTSSGRNNTVSGPNSTAFGPNHISSGRNNTASRPNHTSSGHNNTSIQHNNTASGRNNTSSGLDPTAAGLNRPGNHTTAPPQTTAASEPAGPEWSFVQKPFSLRSRPTINDSALRAYIAPTDPGKNNGRTHYVNRSLVFGLQVAPDFTSVNALAGDRPGSSIGLTVEYLLPKGWHIGTGALFSRKNYTARALDYHVPYDYYRDNNLKGVDFVKGTMSMLEIPLNLRYDFSVTGNTIFFASAGVSTYLFGKEDCNYYYNSFGREVCRDFHYTNKPNGLFSSASLSFGVETVVSPGVSVLVAPYMKLPVSDIGFGKVRMNSVGINFAIRYAPVLRRK